jgi:DNA-binding NarL/FixJ family response regulator
LGVTRVLIADDHPQVRSVLRRLLVEASFDVCGEAADGLEAIESARRLQPDVIVMDLRMPHMNGIEAARAIRAEFPGMPIMLLTVDLSIVAAARKAGIRGSLSKMDLPNLAPGIQALLRGEEFHQED